MFDVSVKQKDINMWTNMYLFYYISVIIYVLCLELLVHKNARVVSGTIVMDNLNYSQNTFHNKHASQL